MLGARAGRGGAGAFGSAAAGDAADAAAFFLIAVGYKTPWTAIASLLHQLADSHGGGVLLQLNLAYLVPSLPLLAVHAAAADALERRLGLPRAVLARLGAGLCGLAALALALPAACGSLPSLLAATAAVGCSYALAFGTSQALVTHFAAASQRALSAGFVACGGVVLAADVWIKRGAPNYDAAGVAVLFRVVAAAALLGWAAAAALVRRHRRRLDAAGAQRSGRAGAAARGGGGGLLGGPSDGGGRSSGGAHIISLATAAAPRPGGGLGLRHHGPGGLPEAAPAAEAGLAAQPHPGAERAPAHGRPGSGRGSHPRRARLAAWSRAGCAAAVQLGAQLRLGAALWPAVVGLGLSVWSSMVAFPFFTFVPRSGALGERLPQVLFYSRLLGDVGGRLVPVPGLHLASGRAVAAAGAAKACALLLLLPALLSPRIVGGDWALSALVFAYWVSSGAINTAALLAAPRLAVAAAASAGGGRRLLGLPALDGGEADVPWHDAKARGISGAGVRARAGGLMALVFQASCLGGLLAAWALQSAMLAGWGRPALGGGPWPGSGAAAAAAAAVSVASSGGTAAAALQPGAAAAAAAGGAAAALPDVT
ncbi:hypothetical protein HT031_003519 [Scenedesmus sp. PABB004]|nr:hypothetical protein HT031_003519 [Scenedesmus sp. PABB004]